MSRENPRRRDHSTSKGGGNFHRRGDGLNTGPVGSNDFGSNSGSGSRDIGGGSGSLLSGGMMKIILIVLAMVFGGGGYGISSMLGDSGSSTPTYSDYTTSSGWDTSSNTSTLNTTVAEGSRAKYTKIIGNNNDTNTIMVYMCGADLESRSGMATKDLVEMSKATLSKNVRIIVYAGGSSRWQNNSMSANTNTIYEIESGKFKK